MRPHYRSIFGNREIETMTWHSLLLGYCLVTGTVDMVAMHSHSVEVGYETSQTQYVADVRVSQGSVKVTENGRIPPIAMQTCAVMIVTIEGAVPVIFQVPPACPPDGFDLVNLLSVTTPSGCPGS